MTCKKMMDLTSTWLQMCKNSKRKEITTKKQDNVEYCVNVGPNSSTLLGLKFFNTYSVQPYYAELKISLIMFVWVVTYQTV